MIYYCVYSKPDIGTIQPFDRPKALYYGRKFTNAREYILNHCKDKNVVMTEEEIEGGEILHFEFVPVLSYTVC